MIKYTQISIASILLVICSLIFNACKKSDTKPVIQTDSIYDIDSNVYRIVKIGNQWWMAENLKVKRYNNGKAILDMTDKTNHIEWDTTLTKGAFCKFNDNKSAPGLLYNWYAVNDSNPIAPKGWHIPTDEEWKQMETYLGMSKTDADALGWRGTKEGNNLKVVGDSGWVHATNMNDVWGDNKSGFSALAGGCRLFKTIKNIVWGDPGLKYTGYWWTATAQPNSNTAWYRYLDYNKSNVFRYNGQKAYGFSIRCVKD